jgi:hypothetical protein
MSAKHTAGPWRYCPANGSPTTGQHMIAGAKPGYLAEVRDLGRGDVIANARLIAAAPDLLHACRLIAENAPLAAEWLRENDPAAYAQVAQAIARATGEA